MNHTKTILTLALLAAAPCFGMDEPGAADDLEILMSRQEGNAAHSPKLESWRCRVSFRLRGILSLLGTHPNQVTLQRPRHLDVPCKEGLELMKQEIRILEGNNGQIRRWL